MLFLGDPYYIDGCGCNRDHFPEGRLMGSELRITAWHPSPGISQESQNWRAKAESGSCRTNFYMPGMERRSSASATQYITSRFPRVCCFLRIVTAKRVSSKL